MRSSLFFDPRVHTAGALTQLTAHELDICLMHYVDGRSQPLIADWMGTSVRGVQKVLAAAVIKVPQLRVLERRAQQPVKPPRTVQFSQLSTYDRQHGPFNADEV